MYVCESTGFPTPTLTWYFNGEPVPNDIVTVNGNELVISSPQVENSGVYECVVNNTIDGEVREDRRQWLLEVRMPSKCAVIGTEGWVMGTEGGVIGTEGGTEGVDLMGYDQIWTL